uniref:Uncharacterized protein n=1 Tax=Acinetobacter phage vB_AbaSt_W16 TaxID=3116434 RepID=A0AB38ZCK3_9CAUD
MNNLQTQLIIAARTNIKSVMKTMRPGPSIATVCITDRSDYDELNRIQKDIKRLLNINTGRKK